MPSRSRFVVLSKKHANIGVLFALLVALIVIGEQVPKLTIPELPLQNEPPPELVTAAEDVYPMSLQIPKLNLQAEFGTQLGLKPNQEIEVPPVFTEVGWYQHSPVPGELGPAVVLGHVDSYEGPAVFFSLGQLEVGDEIIITRSDGTDVVFAVTDSERYEQSSFPTELVYGDLDHAGLRLVTCSGWYDKSTDRYSHNRVVFARLIPG